MTVHQGLSLPHPGLFSHEAAGFPALRLPQASAGQRIGLFGGTFNPPHRGHRHVAVAALKRLGLDEVWWMVTPGNPLKSGADLPPLQRRVALTERFAQHPRMRVTAFESAIGTPFSAEAIRHARARRPGVKFVWVMGADNLASLHRWQNWRTILRLMPVAVVGRPGAAMAPLSAPASRAFSRYRLPEVMATGLADQKPPAWVFLHVPLDPLSSTALRSGSITAGMS